MKQHLLERFLRYTAIASQSDAAAGTVPSTPGQRELAELLKTELAELGFTQLHLSEFSVLTGKLPGNTDGAIPPTGFVAHLDTVDVHLDAHIHPQLIHYEGGDIALDPDAGIYMKAENHPELQKYIGDDILVSSGHSVLGADDKAALASLMTAFAELHQNPTIPHGDLYVAFVPDEEIGLIGAKHLELDRFPVAFAYTLDCCELGEVVFETFNAGTATVHIQGISAHPMSAKGVLVNPTLAAIDLANCFNRLETPENTDGTDGYIWIQSITSNQSTATITFNIRDHHKDLYEAKKAYIESAVDLLKKRYPKAVITLSISDTYSNIKDALTEDNRFCIDYIYQAMEELGITPKTLSMRGGTDGSWLSAAGIPTPNFFTGAHNFHSHTEFLPMNSFEKSCQMVLKLIDIIARKGEREV